MRRWLKLVVAMTLAVLMLSLPAAVLAAAPQVTESARPAVPFTATVDPLVVTDPGRVIPLGGGYFMTVGEKAQGVIKTSDWKDIVGAEVTILHNSVTSVDALGNISGQATGTFLVKKPGHNVIVGAYEANITGQMAYSPTGQMYPAWVTDDGNFRLLGGLGKFKGVSGQGDWVAPLQWNGQTLAGLATLTGKYQYHKPGH